MDICWYGRGSHHFQRDRLGRLLRSSILSATGAAKFSMGAAWYGQESNSNVATIYEAEVRARLGEF